MNRLCPICDKPYELIESTGTLFKCQQDGLHVCFDAITNGVYGDDYVMHYKLYERSDFACQLMDARWSFLYRNLDVDYLLDFGCGAGTFAKMRPKGSMTVFSYDPYFFPSHNFVDEDLRIITFWDSFEHIRRLGIVPDLQAQYIAMSIPILPYDKNILEWKHYRPFEHIWNFTEKALMALFARWDYDLIVKDDFERQMGREDIYSYIFKHK